jgi:hypothetical protein
MRDPVSPAGQPRRAEFLAACETGRKIHKVRDVVARPNDHGAPGVFGDTQAGPATAGCRRARNARCGAAGVDLVIVPKREFFDADFSAIRADVLAAVERATRSPRPATDRPSAQARRPVRH